MNRTRIQKLFLATGDGREVVEVRPNPLDKRKGLLKAQEVAVSKAKAHKAIISTVAETKRAVERAEVRRAAPVEKGSGPGVPDTLAHRIQRHMLDRAAAIEKSDPSISRQDALAAAMAEPGTADLMWIAGRTEANEPVEKAIAAIERLFPRTRSVVEKCL